MAREDIEDTEAASEDTLGSEFEATLAAGGADGGEPAGLQQGDGVGRYVVLGTLGAGGMGVVYAAYDPELDRKVAVKLLRPGFVAAGSLGESDARTRLLREAQALARLNHPNVVAVHDAGAVDGRVWLAMEFVEGETLGDWCERRTRSVDEVIEVMTRAGRGLAAAHQAGLIHRDFKPDNVMVGSDGRVRVMDLGLARSGDAESAAEARAATTQTGGRPEFSALALRVTQAGAMLGTPAYMAPEQFKGLEVGPAADVFAFCVTYWEALHGERPFTGATVVALIASVLAGKIGPTPRGRKVPRWLRRALERGLAVEPARRWASMPALLAAIDHGRSRARLRLLALGLGVALALVGGAWGWQQADRMRRVAACAAAGASIDEVWDDDARARVRAALLATGVESAATTADKLMPWIDRSADAWHTARTEVCLDAEVRGHWSADTLERGSWCLDERRMELAALVTELSRTDAGTLHRAIPAAASLESVAACRDAALLARQPIPPAGRREGIREVRTRLAEVGRLRFAGKYAEGLELSARVLADAEAQDWPALVGAVQYVRGELRVDTGDYAGAATELERAYFTAMRAGAVGLAADVASELARVLGGLLARPAEGRTWARHAELVAGTLGAAAGLRDATRLINVGEIEHGAGAYLEARAHYQRALEILEAELGPGHLTTAHLLGELGTNEYATGDYDGAVQLHTRALAIQEEVLGPMHPEIAIGLNNLAVVHRDRGGHHEARALYERALAIQERSLGSGHPAVAGTLNNLGNILVILGQVEAARPLLERSVQIFERTLGPEHPDLATSLGSLAIVHSALGAGAGAIADYERVLAIQRKALGPEHPALADTLNNLANVHSELGAYAEARAHFSRAREIYERSVGPEHLDVGMILANLADVTEDPDERAALYERAIQIYDKILGPSHRDLAPVLYNYSELLIETHAYARARALLERALAVWERDEGPTGPMLTHALEGLVAVALAQGRAADALALARRMFAICERPDIAPERLLAARYTLARALWDAPHAAGRDRVRARALALQAHQAATDPTQRDAIGRWLARHRG